MYEIFVYFRIMELLLKRDKTIVDTQRDDGCTALHVAAAEDHHEVIKVLTEGVCIIAVTMLKLC